MDRNDGFYERQIHSPRREWRLELNTETKRPRLQHVRGGAQLWFICRELGQADVDYLTQEEPTADLSATLRGSRRVFDLLETPLGMVTFVARYHPDSFSFPGSLDERRTFALKMFSLFKEELQWYVLNTTRRMVRRMQSDLSTYLDPSLALAITEWAALAALQVAVQAEVPQLSTDAVSTAHSLSARCDAIISKEIETKLASGKKN